jgi:hypothetical protein
MMKRTCYGCRALNTEFYYDTCLLGYKNKVVFDYQSGVVIDYIPLEQCPKPKSNEEYVALKFNKILKDLDDL